MEGPTFQNRGQLFVSFLNLNTVEKLAPILNVNKVSPERISQACPKSFCSKFFVVAFVSSWARRRPRRRAVRTSNNDRRQRRRRRLVVVVFFLCFDASVLKNENNIRELTYDDHWHSDRHNSRSLMLLAFFSSDASKQKNTTYEFLNKHRIIRTKLTCRRLFLLVISWLFRSAIMRESLSKWPPSNADMCIWPVLGFTGARSALEGGGANNDRRGYKLALQWP